MNCYKNKFKNHSAHLTVEDKYAIRAYGSSSCKQLRIQLDDWSDSMSYRKLIHSKLKQNLSSIVSEIQSKFNIKLSETFNSYKECFCESTFNVYFRPHEDIYFTPSNLKTIVNIINNLIDL